MNQIEFLKRLLHDFDNRDGAKPKYQDQGINGLEQLRLKILQACDSASACLDKSQTVEADSYLSTANSYAEQFLHNLGGGIDRELEIIATTQVEAEQYIFKNGLPDDMEGFLSDAESKAEQLIDELRQGDKPYPDSVVDEARRFVASYQAIITRAANLARKCIEAGNDKGLALHFYTIETNLQYLEHGFDLCKAERWGKQNNRGKRSKSRAWDELALHLLEEHPEKSYAQLWEAIPSDEDCEDSHIPLYIDEQEFFRGQEEGTLKLHADKEKRSITFSTFRDILKRAKKLKNTRSEN